MTHGIEANAMGFEVDINAEDINVSASSDAAGVFVNSNVQQSDLDHPGDVIITTGNITVSGQDEAAGV